ncbi:hypothetical protein [Myroides marinus]|uniref:hypothetical protein n=1 Tax=Myroides marinus TaxID=703342 RepID=UPI002574FB8F|nr:hypothetical protein [Myroides marinus]MDM1377864.1 hypothetical protein [Myroides marinus]MDM1384932.1 hypothetical protein [Myroides marinus]MDM1392348.1 hypothetical protein [Myroides marinus]
MKIVVIYSWVEGFKKVSFTKWQVEVLGMSLSHAKSNTDAILDGIEVIIEIEDAFLLKQFVSRLNDIGVVYRINN